MIEHIVVIKAKPGREPEVSGILARFATAAASLPGVVEITAARTSTSDLPTLASATAC